MPETLEVVRGDFSMEDPWAFPDAAETVSLLRSTDGHAPRLATRVCAYRDNEYLTFVFAGADDHVVATLYGHDDPIYNEDVYEAFLAPRVESEYFELEVSPIATTFDARIESPEGVRASMKADASWECEGLITATRRTSATFDAVMRIPFASIATSIPKEGEIWRGNLFRVDRHPSHGPEYSSWCPTMRNPADFHVTQAFGRLRFRG